MVLKTDPYSKKFSTANHRNKKNSDRLASETMTLVVAGTLMTSWVLSVTIFYLLTDPDVLGKLRTELQEGIPDPQNLPPLAEIE
jgi:cytochrome P450